MSSSLFLCIVTGLWVILYPDSCLQYIQLTVQFFILERVIPTELLVCSYYKYQLSYQIVDSLIWLGIRGIINGFRKRKLGLRPITYLSGSQGSISDLPTGYIWSPHLVPKPKGMYLCQLSSVMDHIS